MQSVIVQTIFELTRHQNSFVRVHNHLNFSNALAAPDQTNSSDSSSGNRTCSTSDANNSSQTCSNTDTSSAALQCHGLRVTTLVHLEAEKDYQRYGNTSAANPNLHSQICM